MAALFLMAGVLAASPRHLRAGSTAAPRCYARSANASLVDALVEARADAIGRELGRARAVLLRHDRLDTLPLRGAGGVSDVAPGAHAQLLAIVTPASTEAACANECARLDLMDESCRAYTWYGADASRALFGLAAPSAERPGDAKGVCVVATATAPSLSLSRRANAVAAMRVECQAAAGAPELGPDSDFYISGRSSTRGMWAIFFGVLQALGQTSVLVLGGLLLARRGMINAEGAKALSSIGMNLLIPALLFVRVFEAASFELLRTAWLAAALPFVYVPCGVAVGVLCVVATRSGAAFARGMIVAVAFGNSTGLPIIILSVVNSALMSREVRALANEEHGAGAQSRPPLDPLVYLSMYCTTYPLLQWGFGSVLLQAQLPGWLLRAAEPAQPALPALPALPAQPAQPDYASPKRLPRTPLGAIALRGRRGIFGWWLPREGRLLQRSDLEPPSPLPPTPTPTLAAPLSVAVDASAAAVAANAAANAAGAGAEQEQGVEGALGAAQAPQTPATPRDRHFVINVVDAASGMLGRDAASAPARAADEAHALPARAQLGRSATAHDGEARARGGGLANAARMARGAVRWGAPSEPPAAGGAVPLFGRSLTAPGRALADEAAALFGDAARRPAAGEPRRAAHGHHHPRTARLAVAVNLDAIADAEAGLGVAPPMREAELEHVDSATGAHWYERVAFYEEGRQAAARSLRRRRAATASASGRARSGFEGVVVETAGTDSDGARLARAATAGAQPQPVPTPRALLAAASSFLAPRRPWRAAEPPAGSQLLRADSPESDATSTASSDELERVALSDESDSPLGAAVGGVAADAADAADAARGAAANGGGGGDAAHDATPQRRERRLSGNASPGTGGSSVHSLASPPPSLPPGVNERAADARPAAAAPPPTPPSLSVDKGAAAIGAPQPTPHAAGKAGARRWRHLRHGTRRAARFVLDKLLVPPVRATLLGLALGLIPCMRALLLPSAAHGAEKQTLPPLGWLLAGISKLGDAAVPMNLITLGVSLAKGPDFDALPPRAALAIVFAKMVLMPAIALGAIVFIAVVCPVPILHPFEQPFFLTMFVVAATPTANNVLVMCTLSGNDRTAMSTAIFVQYMCSPLILSLSICGFIAIMVDHL